MAIVEDGDNGRAVAALERLLRESSDPIDLVQAGRRLEQLGERQLARRLYQKAADSAPNHPAGFGALGHLELKEGQLESAVVCFQQALAVDPEEIGYLTCLGSTLYHLGQTDKAKEVLIRAVSRDPNYEEAHFNLAVLQTDDDPASAGEHFRHAIALDPNYAIAHREYGWLLAGATDPAAEFHLRQAVALAPHDGWARVYLGNVLWQKGDEQGAEKEFKGAIEAAPDRAYPLWALANLLEKRGDCGEAEHLYQRALEIEPDDVIGLKDYARLLIRKRDLLTAKSYLQRAVLLDPNYSEPRRLLSEISGLEGH